MIPLLVLEKVGYYVFRQKMADVNAQYIEMLDSLFPKESDDFYSKDPLGHFMKHRRFDPCFFQWRNFGCICGIEGERIYGIRNNNFFMSLQDIKDTGYFLMSDTIYAIYIILQAIYNYLMFTPPTYNFYIVGRLPEKYWYSSGKNGRNGWKEWT
jgi:hypothetical protein